MGDPEIDAAIGKGAMDMMEHVDRKVIAQIRKVDDEVKLLTLMLIERGTTGSEAIGIVASTSGCAAFEAVIRG